MARFFELDVEDVEHEQPSLVEQRLCAKLDDVTMPSDAKSTDEQPRTRNIVTEAFQCYPIVHAIVSNIDLNTLDSLARSSFYIHASLLQSRCVLISSTLRCVHESAPIDASETLRYRARAGNWFYMEDGRSYNGKSGHCARDLVGQCRRCETVICRNCAIKPPAPVTLKERHRRLCTACTKAPLAILAKPPLDSRLPFSSEYIQRTLCKCDSEGVWLCQPCGRSIRTADGEYQRIWRWRSHYGEVLGGLGTGIGDGDRGVICGRDEDCLAAKEHETQVDCDAADAKDYPVSPVWAEPSPPTTPEPTHLPSPLEALQQEERRTPSPQVRCGYERHEVEGIGGVVKKTLVKMVRVGACVPEWEDERGLNGKPLSREIRGDLRSWCGWCWRVVPGKNDK